MTGVLGSRASAATAAGWQSPLTPTTVTRAFQPPPTPYSAGHRGVDLAGAPGQAVLAASGGFISFAGKIAGRGVIVVVRGVLRTTYEPVTALVHRGAQVLVGQRIGTLQAGHPGCTAPACLHWGLLRGEVYLDPMSLLTRPTIRLYPPAAIAARPVQAPAVQMTSVNALRAQVRAAEGGPSPTTWSLVALGGAGVLVAYKRR